MNHRAKLKAAKQAHREGLRWDEKLGVFITNMVGTMACAGLFAILAFTGIPAALAPGGIGLTNWFVEEFLQLVLLSVIIVGQNVQSKQSEELILKTYEDSELIKTLINENTTLTRTIHDALRPLPTISKKKKS